MEQMVFRPVAGFMNAEGGTLLIGVADDGEVRGIEPDYKTLGRKQNPDGFALWLTGLLDNVLGPAAASKVSVRFDDLGTGTVCRIDVERGAAPAFVRGAKRHRGLLRPPQQLDKASEHRRGARMRPLPVEVVR